MVNVRRKTNPRHADGWTNAQDRILKWPSPGHAPFASHYSGIFSTFSI
jgi:hypothetical protein